MSSQFISLLFQPSVLYNHLPTHHCVPQRLSPHPSIRFPVLPFHQSPTLRNIVLDCLADAIIVGLYLHNHISHLHSWVLTEARQVKHHTRGDKTMEAHLELRPGLSSAPCHYKKHCWPFLHLANASMSPSPSSLSTFFPQFLGLYYLQPRSISAFSIPSCLFLKLYNFFCPSFFSSIPHSYG